MSDHGRPLHSVERGFLVNKNMEQQSLYFCFAFSSVDPRGAGLVTRAIPTKILLNQSIITQNNVN